MDWPAAPTVHGAQSQLTNEPASWRPPRAVDERGEAETFRTCWYCGSIHPEDLVRLIEAGAALRGADWKYGWPHKFYVDDIPNQAAGRLAVRGTKADGSPEVSEAPRFLHAKWYNEHLEDDGYDEEAIALLLAVLTKHSGIKWVAVVEDGRRRIKYSAPRHNYQR